MKYLSPAQRDAFAADGYLVIDDFIDRPTVARIEADIHRVCHEHRDLDRDRGGFNLEKVGDDSLNPNAVAKRPGMLRKIQGAVFDVPTVREALTGERVLDAMEDLMGPRIFYHSSKVFFKAANGGAPKPWHQDAASWPQYAANQITVWIAIHDAGVGNGCVWAIPGSHRGGLMPHVEREAQIREGDIDAARAVPVPVKPGGMLIFHALVVHMSQRNTSPHDRWAIIGDYDCQPNPALDHLGRRVPGMDEHGVWPLRG